MKCLVLLLALPFLLSNTYALAQSQQSIKDWKEQPLEQYSRIIAIMRCKAILGFLSPEEAVDLTMAVAEQHLTKAQLNNLFKYSEDRATRLVKAFGGCSSLLDQVDGKE